uniref:Transmembrane protein 14C n=1 Tax=Plectus sambesii TaxID=2011161 RepID=A0A914UIV2_9BILA
MADVVGLGYAFVVILGGVIGFIKAGSYPSLIAGLAFGLINGYGAHTGNNTILLGGSGVLAAVMGMRFLSGGKFMPAGLVFVLSAIILARSLYRAFA